MVVIPGQLKSSVEIPFPVDKAVVLPYLRLMPVHRMETTMTDIQLATLILAAPFLGLCAIYAIGIFVVAKVESR